MKDNDNMMIASWKIKGVKDILFRLQESSDEEYSNLYFVLCEELSQALQLLESN